MASALVHTHTAQVQNVEQPATLIMTSQCQRRHAAYTTGTVGPLPIYKNRSVPIRCTVDRTWFRISTKICSNCNNVAGKSWFLFVSILRVKSLVDAVLVDTCHCRWIYWAAWQLQWWWSHVQSNGKTYSTTIGRCRRLWLYQLSEYFTVLLVSWFQSLWQFLLIVVMYCAKYFATKIIVAYF